MKITIDVEGQENIEQFMDALEEFSENIPDGFEVKVIDMEFIYNKKKYEDTEVDWED